MVKVFVANENGKIELTAEELEAMLTEADEAGYARGYRDRPPNSWITWPDVTKGRDITCDLMVTYLNNPVTTASTEVKIGDPMKENMR